VHDHAACHALLPMHCTILIMTIFAYTIDHVEPKSEIQAKQVQGVFGGPQASSCEDANIVVIKASPEASNHRSLSYFTNLYLNYDF
jgi:hypothetical protein